MSCRQSGDGEHAAQTAISLEVREHRPEDIPLVQELFRCVQRELAPSTRRDDFERYAEQVCALDLARIPERYAPPDGGFFVAEAQGSMVGMGGFLRQGPDAAEMTRPCVALSARCLGVGSAIVQRLENEARARGTATWC